MALDLAKTFEEILYPERGLRYRVVSWYREPLESLSTNERLQRVKAINDFILNDVKRIDFKEENAADLVVKKQAFISKNYKQEIEMGVRYLESLNYSPEMHDAFKRIQNRMIAELAIGSHNTSSEKTISKKGWEGIFDNFTKIFFDIAREEFCSKLEDGTLNSEKNHELGHGWIEPSHDTIKSGQLGSVFINHANFYGDAREIVNSVCHEGTHHVMLQWASLVARNEIEVSDDLRADAELILLTFENYAFPSSLIYDMYRANPFERIAFETGDGVAEGYTLLEEILKNTSVEERTDPQFATKITRILQPL